jgi:solute carrier family 25 carnitine/acylcarnitine transporter 20/29
MATVAAFNALLFGTTGYLNRLIRPDGGPPTPAEAALTGAASGVPVALLATPTELLKCRMQRQGGARPRPGAVYTAADAAAGRILYRGAMDAARQIVMFEGGVAALFRGLVPTLFREIPGNAAYFGIYVLAKEKLAAWQGLGSAAELGPGSLMAAGGLAGAAFWAPTIPIDVIKTRIQTDNPLDPGRPRGVAGTAQALLRAEGWAGFVRGWQPCMARSVPANATTFLAYELAHTALSRAAGLGEH